nr:tetratricopeptide repeat protein [Gemmatimonadota bacterium]NIR77764.1 tetratricopeptide repeat protein [Gemmatimonadota bacterium]NIT86300.1 tetratricopeptide repeat protein [Gemmatimonadota bacterium]NIU30134.1 tetratricopeptide repeat protein [Gemmatimonadota bacterium]NIU35074.1 tetratricopeptide repeat protein [Gemmatimonadota bacterium]
EFDPGTGELHRDGETLRLAPKPALVLSTLLDRAGELVARETFQELLWPDTVVEFDKGLNFCVREVRSALGDEAADPRYVETLPRRGYRFIAKVEVVKRRNRESGLLGGAMKQRHLPAAAAALVLLGVAAAGIVGRDGAARAGAPPVAREAAEMGGYLLTRAEGNDVERSVEFFRRAIALDPDYARAHAGLGGAYLTLDRAEEGKRALGRSLELDPEMWSSYLNLALHALYSEYDLGAAAPRFRRALELAPDRVVVRHTYAWFRAVSGDLEDAVVQMRAALDLDPVSPRVNGDVGRLFYLAGRHDEAIAQCRRTQELDPEILRHRDCAVHALSEKEAYAEARAEAVATMSALGASPEARRKAMRGTASVGLRAYWRWAAEAITDLADRGGDSHVHAAASWARAGEADRAFAALERAYAVRCPVLPQMPLDPALRLLDDDPRFTAMLRRIGAPGEAGPL